MKVIVELAKKPLVWIALYLLYALIMYILDMQSCIFKLLFGIPCPGCGMTRAFVMLFKFQFSEAFNCNAMFVIVIFAGLVLLFRKKKYINRLYKSKAFWISIMLIVLAYYIIRMIYVYPNEPMDYYYFNLINKVRGKI